jgi:multidrug efflux pump subunit AcrA (membrane-fusion protein)
MIRKFAWIIVVLLCLGLFFYLNKRSDARVDTHAYASSPVRSGAVHAASARAAAPGAAAQSTNSVPITSAEQQNAGIVVAPVEVHPVARTLTVAGQIEMDEKQTSQVGVIADGRITAVDVLPGDHVRHGAILGYLHSHMVHETAGALMQAYAAVNQAQGAVTFAQQEQARYGQLYGIQAASLEELQRANQGLVQANNLLIQAHASVRMEREHLSELLQVAPETLTSGNLYSRELVPIRSPMNGVVIARNVSVGQVVSAGYGAFVVTNLSTIWVTASVNEQDLSLIRRGADATLTTQAYPGTVFRGRVKMIGDTLDPQTRTVPVRIAVPNPGTQLRPGMFASVRIAEPQTDKAVFVPQGALQNINGQAVVFITQDGTHFRAQAVNAGLSSGDKTEIISGLEPDDRIVVNGAFVVKSEMLKGMMDQD